jgi:hypothetical protein
MRSLAILLAGSVAAVLLAVGLQADAQGWKDYGDSSGSPKGAGQPFGPSGGPPSGAAHGAPYAPGGAKAVVPSGKIPYGQGSGQPSGQKWGSPYPQEGGKAVPQGR